MFRANVFEVKARLSEYLDRAARGERIVICRHNTPVAELRAVEAVRSEPRPIGPLPGRPRFDVPPSFFAPLAPDELDRWEGVGSTDLLSPASAPRAARGARKVAEAKARNAKPAGRSAARRRS